MKIMPRLSSLFLAILIAIFVLPFCSYAIPPHPCDPEYDDMCCEEPPVGPFAFAYPFDRQLSCPQDFYVYGSFLFMQAKEDGLEYAIANNNPLGFPSTLTFPVSGGDVQDFSNNGKNWDFNPGFRAGFAFYINHDLWTAGADLTYINVTNSRSSAVHAGAILLPLWLPPNTSVRESAVNASASWKVKYGTLDFNLGKSFHVSRYLVVNPFFGIRGAWIDQEYIARYGGLFGNTITVSGTNMKASNDFWGFGPRAGVLNEWLIKDEWMLFGKLALAMLYGKFDIEQEVAGAGNDILLADAQYEIHDEFYMNVPNFELALGIGWGMRFNKERYYVSLKIAYELNYWWDQNRMRRFRNTGAGAGGDTISTDTISRGDLSFNGFSFRLFFDL